ncbi:TGB protein 3 [Soybean carlavirus 1]|uniref:Movement protein TGBp3 n=1 Tax=Soybean carlavirus 1 TaxID=2796532 RepID=A0A7T8G1Z8_9VIRU|nr:TGB protein 3 [Soybean carlavirus 1]QPZ88461.1 TGB protein 3 [Soybean carlavirus 1]QQP18693.1 triple gene block 3 protein [Soybean carlavirus 1]QTW49394.1 triple gene block protein 3 [Soybean carlavirus 1]
MNILLAYTILVCLAIAYLLAYPKSECVVIITGESVKIIGCDRVEGFAEIATKLRPAFHRHL